MPRGHKSKLRAREKRRQAQDKPQGLQDAQATAADDGDAVPSTSTADFPQKPQGAAASSTAAAHVPSRKSGKGAKRQGEEKASSSGAPPSAERAQKDFLLRRAGMLMQYMLCKYKMKEPIMRGEMVKIINKRFREQFPEILKKASDRMEVVFGLELQEIKPGGNSFTLVNKVDVHGDESVTTGLGFPKNGVLMPLLGAIFLNGNSASEEEIWEFLNVLGIYDGKRHILFGEPRKLITQDLVQEEYLEYRQVANSDPPCYVFRWGLRARAEISKMKVLEFLAKVNDTVPTDFPSHYAEALRDEEEGAQAIAAARLGASVKAKACSRATPGSSSCP